MMMKMSIKTMTMMSMMLMTKMMTAVMTIVRTYDKKTLLWVMHLLLEEI